jgi:hypothetical protein
MPGLLRGLARTAMVAGTATAVSNRVSRRQAGRWAAQDYQQEPQPQPQQQPVYAAPPPSAPEGGDDVIEQLKDLADLKAQGVLTEEEFEVQKRRVLGG